MLYNHIQFTIYVRFRQFCVVIFPEQMVAQQTLELKSKSNVMAMRKVMTCHDSANKNASVSVLRNRWHISILYVEAWTQMLMNEFDELEK